MATHFIFQFISVSYSYLSAKNGKEIAKKTKRLLSLYHFLLESYFSSPLSLSLFSCISTLTSFFLLISFAFPSADFPSSFPSSSCSSLFFHFFPISLPLLSSSQQFPNLDCFSPHLCPNLLSHISFSEYFSCPNLTNQRENENAFDCFFDFLIHPKSLPFSALNDSENWLNRCLFNGPILDLQNLGSENSTNSLEEWEKRIEFVCSSSFFEMIENVSFFQQQQKNDMENDMFFLWPFEVLFLLFFL